MSQSPESFALALAARGLALRIVGNRLRVFDASGRSAWPSLTPEERAYIGANRVALKRHLRGLPPAPGPLVAPEPEPAPEPEAPRREVPEHVRRILEWNTPAEVERRNREATAIMWLQLGKRSPLL